jgi:hypothetical protein
VPGLVIGFAGVLVALGLRCDDVWVLMQGCSASAQR